MFFFKETLWKIPLKNVFFLLKPSLRRSIFVQIHLASVDLNLQWIWKLKSTSVCSNPPQLCLGGFMQTSEDFSQILLASQKLHAISYIGNNCFSLVHTISSSQLQIFYPGSISSVVLCMCAQDSHAHKSYLKHTWSIFEAYLKHTWIKLEAYLKYTWIMI